MKKREVPASFPLLGLLTWGPANGYQLHQRAKQSLAHFWTEGFAQIYPSLDYFHAEGMVTIVNEEGLSQRSRTFALTDQGYDQFRRWLEKPVESYAPRRHELLVKVFFGRHLDPAVLQGHLDRYQTLQRQWVAQLTRLGESLGQENPNNPDLPFWRATLHHGVALGTALDQWCQETSPATPPH